MSRTRARTRSRKCAGEHEIAGVELMPLPEYLAALDESCASAQRALCAGRFRPDDIQLPPSRTRVVLKTRAGRRVTPVTTERGIEYRSIAPGQPLDLPGSGGAEGGFLDIRVVPPVAPDGVAAAPAAWVPDYLRALPRFAELNDRNSRWWEATGCFEECVGADRRADDEWRQRYFRAIRAAAARRFPISASTHASPRGPRACERSARWNQTEWHQSFYRELSEQADSLRRTAEASGGLLPLDGFASALDPSIPTALFRSKPRTFDAFADGLLETAQHELSARMRDFLKSYVDSRAAALTRRGGPLPALQEAFEVISQLNEAGALELLAGLADRAVFPGAPDGTANPVDIDLLKGRFAEQLSTWALDGAFDEVLGEEAAKLLQSTGLTGLFGNAASDLLLNGGPSLGGLADKLMDQLPGALVDQALDRLIGPVNDRSSLAAQVVAKYKDQIKSLLKPLMTAEGREALQKKFEETFDGAKSSACVRFGLANAVGGADLVLINNLPATRLNDDCLMPDVPDKGKFFQGNPTILVNGMPPASEIHAAIGVRGTIATPMIVSPDVLMGSTTVTVAIQVEAEAPVVGHGDRPRKPGERPPTKQDVDDAKHKIRQMYGADIPDLREGVDPEVKILKGREFDREYEAKTASFGFEVHKKYSGFQVGDKIVLNEELAGPGTPYHELLHHYSAAGFKREFGGSRDILEGLTEYFTRQIFPGNRTSYQEHMPMMNRLRSEVGESTLRRAFFEGDRSAMLQIRRALNRVGIDRF